MTETAYQVLTSRPNPDGSWALQVQPDGESPIWLRVPAEVMAEGRSGEAVRAALALRRPRPGIRA